jgi:hypothetical protein
LLYYFLLFHISFPSELCFGILRANK